MTTTKLLHVLSPRIFLNNLMREAVLSAPLGGDEEAGREVEVICAVSLFPSALLTFGADSHGSGRLVGAVEEA